MKKVLLSVAVVAAFGLASCGGPSVCDCVKMGEDMAKDMEDAAGDEEKMKEVEDKYADKIKECEELGKDASEEDQEKMMEEAKDC